MFLLSIAEAETLFASKADRTCQATAYAKKHGANVLYNNGNGWWWLRSAGGLTNYAAYVNYDGSFNDRGIYATYGGGVVRPVVVLRLY